MTTPTYAIGQHVVVVADTIRSDAWIVSERASSELPASHWQVRTADGETFWAYDHELQPAYDSYADTKAHIGRVQELIGAVLSNLADRALAHDASKLLSPEKEAFDVATPLLKETTYGTPAYDAAKARLGDALTHHYRHNDHHPEHKGIEEMSLLSLLEMLADWKAASERGPNGSLVTSLQHAREQRWVDQSLLVQLLENTARELGW